MSEARDRILEKYLKVCADAAEDDTVFARFKSIPDYVTVLEHCSFKLGLRHWGNIRHNYFSQEEWNNFLQNDFYGWPNRYQFDGAMASPTTIQYISVLSNLITAFGSLEGFKICEIGGGYGGQAKIVKDKFKCEYHIVDLYECTLLQKTYLEKLNQFENVELFTNENYPSQDYDLFISNYAVSEVSAEDQLQYVKDIMLKSKRGYVTCNQPLNGLDLLKQKFNVVISADIEGERKDNFVISWK